MWVLTPNYSFYTFLHIFCRWVVILWFPNNFIPVFFAMKRLPYFCILVLLLVFVNFNYLIFIIFYLYLFVLQLNSIIFFINTKLLDLGARTLLDYFVFNNFYFLWTNLWYIFSYFILLSYLYLCFKNKIICLPTVLHVSICIFLLVSVHCDFINSNFYVLDIYSYPTKENILLTNSVNKVHPLLLHSSFSLFLIYVFLKTYPKSQYTSFFYCFFYKYVKKTVAITIGTLYLGSWWALQEGSWGGWWNWDISEVFGLILLFRVLFYLHYKVYITYYTQLLNYTRNSIIFFIFFYCSMQINFSIVSHNFGFRSLKSFNPELFFLALTLYILLLFLKNAVVYINNIAHYQYYKFYLVPMKYFIIIAIASLFYVSILNLLQNFMWNTFGFKAAVSQFDYKVYFILVLTIFIPFLLSYNLLGMLYFNLFTVDFFYIFFMYIKVIHSYFNLSFIHLLLIFSLVITSFKGLNFIDIWWIILKTYDSKMLFNYSFNSTKLESFFNFIKQTTAPEGKSFSLDLRNSFLIQTYFPSGEPVSYFTRFIDISIPLLNTILLLFSILFFSIFFKKSIF